MAAETDARADEIKRLQGCINNLISIQTLPAIWSGQDSSEIIGTLLDVLVRVLELDFAYGRTVDERDGSSREFIRMAQRRTVPAQASEVGRAFAGWLSAGSPYTPFVAPNPFADGMISAVPFRLGLEDDIGFLLAASRRQDFPSGIELMLLRVAANQAVIGLHEARLLSEQKRLSDELERDVVERTAQLTAANEQVKVEMRERERGEEEIRKLAALVENSSDFIGIASLEGEVQFVNRAGQQMVGLDGDEHVRATRVIDYVAEDDRDIFQRQILPTVMREGRWQGERRFRHFKTGAAIPTWQHIFFIMSPGGDRPVAMATVSRDLTERNRAEDDLRTSQEHLARVARITTMGELVASIAHEVNQPLSAIVTNSGAGLRWLAAARPDLDEARQAFDRIVRDGNRASDVIVRIRALMKKTAPEKAPLNVNETIQDVVILAQGEMRRNGVSLRMELADDPPLVMGDRVQLQQVVLNLIMNGIEAMSAVADRPRELVVATQMDPGDGLHVSIRDSGVGLEPRHTARMFDAFYTTKPQGTGMGLSISRSIIHEHKGRLWATPNEGPGATLHFLVPVAGTGGA